MARYFLALFLLYISRNCAGASFFLDFLPRSCGPPSSVDEDEHKYSVDEDDEYSDSVDDANGDEGDLVEFADGGRVAFTKVPDLFGASWLGFGREDSDGWFVVEALETYSDMKRFLVPNLNLNNSQDKDRRQWLERNPTQFSDTAKWAEDRIFTADARYPVELDEDFGYVEKEIECTRENVPEFFTEGSLPTLHAEWGLRYGAARTKGERRVGTICYVDRNHMYHDDSVELQERDPKAALLYDSVCDNLREHDCVRFADRRRSLKEKDRPYFLHIMWQRMTWAFLMNFPRREVFSRSLGDGHGAIQPGSQKTRFYVAYVTDIDPATVFGENPTSLWASGVQLLMGVVVKDVVEMGPTALHIGIHKLPWRRWRGVKQAFGDQWRGCCTAAAELAIRLRTPRHNNVEGLGVKLHAVSAFLLNKLRARQTDRGLDGAAAIQKMESLPTPIMHGLLQDYMEKTSAVENAFRSIPPGTLEWSRYATHFDYNWNSFGQLEDSDVAHDEDVQNAVKALTSSHHLSGKDKDHEKASALLDRLYPKDKGSIERKSSSFVSLDYGVLATTGEEALNEIRGEAIV